MGFFSSSSKQSPAWTTGSFPGAMQVQVPGYSYAYSPSPVWQAQPVMAVPQYTVPVMSFQAPPPVQAPVQFVSVSPQMAISSPMPPQSATYTVVQQSTVATPSTNALLLSVPSPRISHAILASPRRSPRPPPPPAPAPEVYVVQDQPQQQVHWQQQQQGQPTNFSIQLIVTPQQGPAQLPGSTPAPPPAQISPGIPTVTVTDDDDESSEEDSDTQHNPHHHQHHQDPPTRKPPPTRSPNSHRHSGSHVTILSPHPLSALGMPTLQFPFP